MFICLVDEKLCLSEEAVVLNVCKITVFQTEKTEVKS